MISSKVDPRQELYGTPKKQNKVTKVDNRAKTVLSKIFEVKKRRSSLKLDNSSYQSTMKR